MAFSINSSGQARLEIVMVALEQFTVVFRAGCGSPVYLNLLEPVIPSSRAGYASF